MLIRESKSLNKKIWLKRQDEIVTTFPQVNNSNVTVLISTPQLKAQVKKEFNPE